MTVLTSARRAAPPLRRRATGARLAGGESIPAAEPPRRRELGPQRDQALYTCGCGFVFRAPVSTTVDCPHCGGAQAW